MSDWKSKRLDRIDSDGLSAASKPYRDGDYWCVTVRVSYEHIYAYDDQSSVAAAAGLGMATNKDALKRTPAVVLLYPGRRGANNAILEGLQSLSRAFLSGLDWYAYYTRSEVFGEIDPLDAASAADPDVDALLEQHLLFKGPIIDTRPFGSFARYQIGVHYSLIEGWIKPGGTSINPNVSPMQEIPPLSYMSDIELYQSAPSDEVVTWPVTWQQKNTAKTELSKFVLGGKWNPGVEEEPSFIKFSEYMYDSFQEFENQVETLALHLNIRQKEHEDLKDQRFYFKNTETILNFNNYADALRDCARQIKSFLIFNGINTTTDPISFGYYPAIPEADFSNPTYNPDRSAFNFAEGLGATHTTRNGSTYMFNVPNPPESSGDQGTFYDNDYLVSDSIPEGTYVREVERTGDFVRVKILPDAPPEQEDPPSPLEGVTGWVHQGNLKLFTAPEQTELQSYQSLLEASGYLAYVRCPKRSVLDTEDKLQSGLTTAVAALELSPESPQRSLKPIRKVERRKVGNEYESDARFRKRLNFHWIGFSAFLESAGFRNKTIIHFLKAMNSINNRPGNDYDSLKFQACRGFPKPGASGAERLALIGNRKKRGFVDTYVLEEVERRPFIATDDASELTKYFDSFKDEFNFAETKSDVDFVKDITASKTMRYVIANRNRTLTNQAGDALFAALPANVDKVRSWDDLYSYVLNRVDIPTIFYKLMDCIKVRLSLDDLIQYLCDEFLRSIGTSPEEVDRFFEILENKIVDASTIETGLGDRYNVELVDPYQLMQDIKTGMAEYAAQNLPLPDSPGQEEIAGKTVDDEAFYRAAIAAIGDNPNNRYFLCELILAGMFSLGYLIYQALAAEKDLDPIEADKLSRKIKEEGGNIGKGCALPWLNLPNAVSVVDRWLASILRQLEEKLYQYVEEKVFEPINEALLKLIDCGEDDENYGLIPLDDLLPAGPEDPALSQKIGPLGIDSPRDFLSALVAILTPLEICALLDGVPKTDTLVAIKGFMQSNYPESYSRLNTDIKIITFFQDLRSFFDTSVCLVDYPPNDALQDFCNDGETKRHAAIRASLSQRGLSEEQIDAQIELDKQLTKEQISNIVQMATLGQGKKSPLDSESSEAKSFMNDIMASSESTMRQSKYAIDTILEPINNAFVLDLGTFIPSLFSEIIKLRNLGLDISRLPFYELLRGAYNPNYESTYYNSHAGLNRMFMWAPRIEFVPGTRDMNPLSANYLKYQENTADLRMLGGKYQRHTSNPGNCNIRYELAPYNDISNSVDTFNFRLDGRKASNTSSGYVSDTKLHLSAVTREIPDNLGEFANAMLKDQTVIDMFKDLSLPYQVSVFKAILAWHLTRGNSWATSVFPPYKNIYGSSKDLLDRFGQHSATATFMYTAKMNKYFKVVDTKIKYDNFLFGVDDNVDMLSIVYDQIAESYNKKIAEITSNSDLFDLQRLSEIDVYSSSDSAGLLGIKKLAQDTANKAQQLMRRIDLEGGEAPTHIADAMYEGLIQVLAKLHIAEMIMSCLYMFSRFRPSDVFSDELIIHYIKSRIEETAFPDGSSLEERYTEFLFSQELKLRKFMSEKEGLSTPKPEEIDARVKKDIYKNTKGPSQTLDKLIMQVSEGVAEETKKVIEEILDLTLDTLEQEVIDYEASGAAEAESENPEGPKQPTYPKPKIDEVVVLASDVNWNGLEDPYRYAHKIWIWEGTYKNTISKNYISETDLELKNKILREALDDEIAFADADESGAESFGNFRKIMPSKATTTCLRELLLSSGGEGSALLNYGIARPAEIPIGVDIAQGGTTWDFTEALTFPVDPPIVRNVGVISSLTDGWDIEISFDFAKMEDTTSASDNIIDKFQQNLLTQYGLAGKSSADIDFSSLTKSSAKFASGFLEEAMGFSYPPHTTYTSGKGYIDQETLDEHDYVSDLGSKYNRKAKFRVRSGPAETYALGIGTTKAYAAKRRVDGKPEPFYKPFKIKFKQQNQKSWYPSPSDMSVSATVADAIEINKVPLISKVVSKGGYTSLLGVEVTEESFVEQHSTAGGIKHGGLNRYRVVKKQVNVPVKIIVEEYTGENAFNPTPKKGKVPKFRYEYEQRTLNVLEEIISERSVVQPGKNWKAAISGGSSQNSGQTADLVAGYAAPQQKEMWQTLNEAGVLDTSDFAKHPMIQIRPPVYWFNEDTHLGNPLQGGDDQEHEVFVPDVQNFKLNIKGKNFTDKTRAYLQPISSFGSSIYPFNIEVISDSEINLEMPLQVYLGDRMFDPNPPSWWVPGWQNSKAPHGEYEDQTGSILTMAGVPVIDQNIYVLVVDNNGEREVASMYFTTFNDPDRVWNDAQTVPQWMKNSWPSSKPEVPGMAISLGDINATSPTTAFNMPVYPISTDDGTYVPEVWDVVDVATIIGNERVLLQANKNSNPSSAKNAIAKNIFVCEPRINQEKYRGGGFILEKYVRLKFKSENDLKNSGKANLTALSDFLYDSAEKSYNEVSTTIADAYESQLRKVIISPAELGSPSLINGLSVDNGKCNDIVMSYSSFSDLLRSMTGGSLLKPSTIGTAYSVEGSENALLAFYESDKPGDLAKRISINKPGWFEGAPANTHGYEDLIGAKIWESIDEFVDFDRSAYPYSTYDFPSFEYEFPFPGKGTATVKGFKIVRTDPDPSTRSRRLNKAVTSTPWEDILEDVAFGLRLTYVLPEVKGTKNYPDHYSTAFEPRYKYVDLNTKRQSVDNQIKNRLNPWYWNAAPSSYDERTSDVQLKQYLAGEEIFVLSPKYVDNLNKAMHCFKINHFKEVDPGGDKSKATENFFFPIVSVEIDPSSPHWPDVFDNAPLAALEKGYPEAKPLFSDSTAIIRRNMYKELYKKLRTDSKFKLLFEYMIASKRILSLNAIYNMMNFEQFFMDKCTFPSIFGTTRNLIKSSVVLTQDYPSGGKVDGDDVPVFPDVQKKLQEMTTLVASGDACAPNLRALADQINRDKLI